MDQRIYQKKIENTLRQTKIRHNTPKHMVLSESSANREVCHCKLAQSEGRKVMT